MAVYLHTWLVNWTGQAVHVIGMVLHNVAEHGMPVVNVVVGI